MNPDTGEIYNLPAGQQPRSGHIALSGREATYLKRRAAKERTAALKRLRRSAIRAAKRQLGRRLTADECVCVLEPLKKS